MVSIYCKEDGSTMKYVEGSTDDRQEWVEETYECPLCGKTKIHRTTFDQNGFVMKDEVL